MPATLTPPCAICHAPATNAGIWGGRPVHPACLTRSAAKAARRRIVAHTDGGYPERSTCGGGGYLLDCGHAVLHRGLAGRGETVSCWLCAVDAAVNARQAAVA